MAASVRVTLRKSIVGTNPRARGTIRALGLRRIGQTVEVADDAAMRGQIRAVRYLVEVEEVAAAPAKRASKKDSTAKKEEAAS
jgi:large subunit ribosomal protein L30